MNIANFPYTVHEAEVAVFHAWEDGIPVGGPLERHLRPPIGNSFRVGLTISQSEVGVQAPGFGEWRLHRPQYVEQAEWTVEMSAPLGAVVGGDLVHLASLLPLRMPVVVVVRFVDREKGFWRLLQFFDCVSMASDAAEQSEVMMRGLRFSSGWMEEVKSGAMPALEPRLRPVIEWRHLGRSVRCWEYDPIGNTWQEDEENLEGEDRYVSLLFNEEEEGDVVLSYLAARTKQVTRHGLERGEIEWTDAFAFAVGSSGLTLDPGWEVQAYGCAEPLRLPPSGRHWEHPRVVFRFLGRIYATLQSGVFAMPYFTEGSPDATMDTPILLGRMAIFPQGGWLLPVQNAILNTDGVPLLNTDNMVLENT